MRYGPYEDTKIKAINSKFNFDQLIEAVIYSAVDVLE